MIGRLMHLLCRACGQRVWAITRSSDRPGMAGITVVVCGRCDRMARHG